MSTVLRGGGGALVALALLSACGDDPNPHHLDHGPIVQRVYTPAYDEHYTVCVAYGKYGCTLYIPQTDHHDAVYGLVLEDCEHREKPKHGEVVGLCWRGTITVSLEDYKAMRVGDRWPR